jgi:hypothetical protein
MTNKSMRNFQPIIFVIEVSHRSYTIYGVQHIKPKNCLHLLHHAMEHKCILDWILDNEQKYSQNSFGQAFRFLIYPIIGKNLSLRDD